MDTHDQGEHKTVKTNQESETPTNSVANPSTSHKSEQSSETAANAYGRRSLWVQGTIAFATLIYVLIAIFQLGAMKSTLEETRKSAEAAKIAADAAADSAKTTRLALELSAVPEVQPEAVTCSTPVGADSRVTLHFAIPAAGEMRT